MAEGRFYFRLQTDKPNGAIMVKKDQDGLAHRKIGDYLGCGPELLKNSLERQKDAGSFHQRPFLGSILVEAGLITADHLSESLIRQRQDRLADCALFKDLGENDLRMISEHAVEVRFDEGEEFIVQDSPGDCFYLLIQGRAFVYRKDEYEDMIPICHVNPGESIGEMGYFSDGRRLASVKTVDRSLLLKISYADLESLFRSSSYLARTFLDLITQRLRKTNLRFERTVAKSRRAERYLENIYELLDMSDVLSLRKGIESQIERIVTTARKIMNAERATLFLLDEFSGELWSMLAEGLTCREIRISRDTGVAGWVVQHGKMVHIDDAYADSRFDPAIDKLTGFTTRSILCGPLLNLKGELVGVLQVINKQAGQFDRADESFFSAFSYQTAIAVENLQLYKRLIRDHEKMAILFDVATHVARTLDLDTLFLEIVAKVSEVLQAERSSLFLVDRDSGELWSKVAQKSDLRDIRFPMDRGLAGHVAITGETLNIRNAYEDPRFLASVDERTGFVTHSVLCAPIINRGGEIIGVVQAMNKKGADFDEDDEDLIRALCSHMAVALENARLFEKTVEMKNYLASVQESISNAIVTLDEEFRVVTVNRAARSLLRNGSKVLEKSDFRSVLGEGNFQLTQDILQVLSSGKSMVGYDVDLILPSGAQHVVNVNVVPLVDAAGTRNGIVVVLEDITREKRMKSTLVRYMAKDIVEKLLNDPAQQTLGGRRGKATIMFSDIRGYTGITESLSAEETVAFLNEYFSLMVNVIFENDGVLDKYLGDGIMSVFGAPYSREDDAIRAVRTALTMQEKLKTFNQARLETGKAPIHIGIGVSTGEVISGNIGSERRMEYTVIGDGVNVASRIEKLTKHYGAGILISDSTAADLADEFTLRSVDLVKVRGKQKPVEIFEVLGEKNMVLSQAQRDFQDGMNAYRNRDFEKARAFFLKGADQDNLCRVFLERCVQVENTDNKDWDGVWVSPY